MEPTLHRLAAVAALLAVSGAALAQPVDGVPPRGDAALAVSPTPAVGPVRAAADVRAEAAEAVAAGAIAHGDAAAAEPASASRASRRGIAGETRMAMRLQLIVRGDAPQREATAHERELIRLAGERARQVGPLLAAR